MIILAGDIGGTTSRFQWLDTESPHRFQQVMRYVSAGFPSFEALLKQLLADSGVEQVDVACFGLPGPVNGAEVSLTNLPWRISACGLQTALPIARVQLLNDFQAAALGIDLVESEDIVCLYPGEYDAKGNRLVIGAGTGLGVAPVYQLEGRFYPQPSEGGHMAFAPINDEQERLLLWLHRNFGYVAYENLLSGEGLIRLYQFCADQAGKTLTEKITAAAVTERAEQGESLALCALSMFVTIYGQFIGDIALIWPAQAGIYIAGGIGAKIVPWMRSRSFRDAFLAKDKMCGVVEKMPVYLVLDDLIGLKGAFQLAQRTGRDFNKRDLP